MILQRDPRLRKEIQEWGCYLMDIFFLVNKYTNFPFSPEIINSLYDKFVLEGWMDTQCTIQDPQRIFYHLKMPVAYHDKHDPPEYVCKPDEIEILCWENDGITHFTVGDGHGRVTYDPMGCSKTVKWGALKSKRVFTLINGEAC